MKLSEFKNEEAIDVLADLMSPIVVITTDQEFTKRWNSGKPVVYAFEYILKNYKKEVIQMIAALHREDPEKMEFTIPMLMRDLIELVNDPVVQAFFPTPTQKSGVGRSGSATENTEVEA